MTRVSQHDHHKVNAANRVDELLAKGWNVGFMKQRPADQNAVISVHPYKEEKKK